MTYFIVVNKKYMCRFNCHINGTDFIITYRRLQITQYPYILGLNRYEHKIYDAKFYSL